MRRRSAVTTLVHEPGTLVTLALIVVVSVAHGRDWKRRRRVVG